MRHRHVEVNGRSVDVPSYQLRPGDEIRITKASRELDVIAASLELASKGQPVSWVARSICRTVPRCSSAY